MATHFPGFREAEAEELAPDISDYLRMQKELQAKLVLSSPTKEEESLAMRNETEGISFEDPFGDE